MKNERSVWFYVAILFAVLTLILVPTLIAAVGGSPGIGLVAAGALALLGAMVVSGVQGYRQARHENKSISSALLRGFGRAFTFMLDFGV